jgi:hypothetical protein
MVPSNPVYRRVDEHIKELFRVHAGFVCRPDEQTPGHQVEIDAYTDDEATVRGASDISNGLLSA